MSKGHSAKGTIYIIGERHFEGGLSKGIKEMNERSKQLRSIDARLRTLHEERKPTEFNEELKHAQKLMEQVKRFDRDQPFLAFENEIKMIKHVVEQNSVKLIFVESFASGAKSFLGKTLEKIYPKVPVLPLAELDEFHELAEEIAKKMGKHKKTLDVQKYESLPLIEQIRTLDADLDLEGDWNRMSMRRQGVWVKHIERHFLDPSLVVCGSDHVIGGSLNRWKTVPEHLVEGIELLKGEVLPYKSLPSMLEEIGFKTEVVAYATE